MLVGSLLKQLAVDGVAAAFFGVVVDDLVDEVKIFFHIIYGSDGLCSI